MANRNACWVESNPLWNDEMINLIPFTFPAKCDLIVILKFYVLQICVYIISKSVNKREKYDLEFMMTFLLEKQGRLFTCRSFTQTFFFLTSFVLFGIFAESELIFGYLYAATPILQIKEKKYTTSKRIFVSFILVSYDAVVYVLNLQPITF